MAKVFFVNSEDNYKLYYYDTILNKIVQVTENKAQFRFVDTKTGDIYYSKVGYAINIYIGLIKVNVNTGMETVLWTDETSETVKFDGNYIYISGNNGKVNIVNTSGDLVKILDYRIEYPLKYRNRKFYFVAMNEDYTLDLCSYNMDTDRTNIIAKNIKSVNFESEIIYSDASSEHICLVSNNDKCEVIASKVLQGREHIKSYSPYMKLLDNYILYSYRDSLSYIDIYNRRVEFIFGLEDIISKYEGVDINCIKIINNEIFVSLHVYESFRERRNYVSMLKVNLLTGKICFLFDKLNVNQNYVWYKNYVYFTGKDQGLYRCNIYSEEKVIEELFSEYVTSFKLVEEEGSIIFSTPYNDFYLSIMNIDGTRSRQISFDRTDTILSI